MAGVKSSAQRIGMFIMAALFLVTSLAFTGVVIWQFMQENKEDELSSEYLDGSTQLDPNATDVTQPTEEDMLEGTNLEGFQPLSSPVSELQIIDTQEGTGDTVPEGATITAHYTGAVASTGKIFQSSHDGGQPIQFSLDGVIAGWTQGVPGMKVGGKRRLIIPTSLAYGANPPSASIPANADLVFDIELVSID